MHTAGGRARLDVRIGEKRFLGANGQPIEVARDLAFAVEPREFVCLLGPSGCGKTTTLRIVLGLDRDYRGAVTGLGDRLRIAAVFQEPRLLPWRTVEQNVRIALPDAEAGKPLHELFQALGLEEMRNRYPGELSLGLARRAAIARAFALEPELLVLDEPFVSLDAQTAGEMRRLLLKLWQARPTTVLMVTHNVREAAELANRLVFLSPRPARVLGEMPIAEPQGSRDAQTQTVLMAQIERRFPGIAGLA